MGERQVGVRELKAKLSQYLREVKAGHTVVVTERGRPVATLGPTEQNVAGRLEAMRRAGLVEWSGRKLEPKGPVASLRGDRTVAELLIEDRE